MNKAGAALLFILLVDVLLFFSQLSMDAVNPNHSLLFEKDKSIIGDYDSGNLTVKGFNTNELPSYGASVEDSSGNIFTDTYGVFMNWITQKWDSFVNNPIVKMVNAVPRTLSLIFNATPEISFAFGSLWHVFTIFLVVQFARGD